MTYRRPGSSRVQKKTALLGAAVLPLALGLGLTAGCAGVRSETPADGTTANVSAPAVDPVVVSGMEVSAQGEDTRVRLSTSRAPRHRLTVSQEPPAAELVLYDVSFEGLSPRVEVDDGTLDTIEVSALPGGGGRVVLALAGASEARVEPWPGGLDILVTPKTPSLPASPVPAARITRAMPDGTGIAFEFGARPENLSAFVLSDGRRLVVDAEGVSIGEPQITEEYASGPVGVVRLGRQEGRVRAVVEARKSGTFDDYRLEKRDDGFALLLGATGGIASAAPSTATLAAASVVGASGGQEYPGGGQVSDLGFHQDAQRSYVDLKLSKPAPHEVREATGQRVVVDLLNTTLPERFRRALDTSAFPGPVQLIAAYPRGKDTRLVIDLRRPVPFQLERDPSDLSLSFAGGSEDTTPRGAASAGAGGGEIIVLEGQSGVEAGGAKPREAAPGVPEPPVYTGRKLSMDFVAADIRNVLRLIGEVSGLNMVAGDDVQGKLTVRLVDVPWDQALDVILKTRGLGQVREGNVIRIAPAERIAQEKARALEEAKAAEEQEPLITDIIPVNYAAADELMDKVQSILSERGSLSVDARTNSILVKDVAGNVQAAKDLVARLDTQTPQVLIEARIVEVSSTFSRDLGIQWGGTFTDQSTGWAFPHSIGLSGDTGNQNFAVNFPSTGGLGGGAGGALALTLGHVNDVLTLDLRLSAIESSGNGRVVSAPRVTTLDNKTAEISQGTEIPFTTATEEKIETQSIDYLLILNVTPHVTTDGSIILKIDVTKDAPSTSYFAVDTRTPAKETRAATTEVLVRDGETTVIGGIITDTSSHSTSNIPFLSNIPGLGWMFKKKDDSVDKTELIIFITPKIVNGGPEARSI